MERLALIARLKPGSEPRARALIAKGPPFDLRGGGFVRHSVFLSSTEVVFVFEAPQVEWLVDSLVDEPFHWMLREALDEWRPLVEGQPRIAREQFFWDNDPPAEEGSD
ncbi:MAG: hypothetical protein ACM3QU_04005 [Verrucomicrobiota bacterium]